MEVKLIEVRDKATTMPMMAVKLFGRSSKETFLLHRAGYALEQIGGNPDIEPYVILCKLDGVEAQYDPYGWRSGARTIPNAHQWLIAHWHEVKSGDVIDVEFLFGETKVPKRGEHHAGYGHGV